MTAGQMWSREKPTKVGWYWLKETYANCRPYGPHIVEIAYGPGGLRVYGGSNPADGTLLRECNESICEWCGPLEPPHDQEAG